jgi:hypothetical protein
VGRCGRSPQPSKQRASCPSVTFLLLLYEPECRGERGLLAAQVSVPSTANGADIEPSGAEKIFVGITGRPTSLRGGQIHRGF